MQSSIQYFFIDGHSHIGLSIENGNVIVDGINFLKERKFDALTFSLPVDKSKTDSLIERLRGEVNQIKKLEKYNLDFEYSKIEQAKHDSLLSLMFGLEYFHGILKNNIDVIKELADLKIQYITLVDNSSDSLFVGNELSHFGKQIVSELNKYKIFIDISHLAEQEALAIIEFSSEPIIASHSCIRGVTNLKYNLSDKVIEKIVKKKGLIMISFNKNDLFTKNENSENGVKRFCEHVDYIKNFAGIEYVAIGSDLQANGRYVPNDLNKENTILEICKQLSKMGYSYLEIEMIMSRNLHSFINKKFD